MLHTLHYTRYFRIICLIVTIIPTDMIIPRPPTTFSLSSINNLKPEKRFLDEIRVLL